MAPSAVFLAAVMAWVAQATGLPPAPLPRVVLTAEAPGGTVLERLRSAPDGRQHAAAMTMPDGTVYLPPGWDARNALDAAVLAHELAHVLQFASGRKYRCTAEMEPLAWFVEDYYLEQHGVDFWRVKGIQAFAIAEAVGCAG